MLTHVRTKLHKILAEKMQKLTKNEALTKEVLQ